MKKLISAFLVFMVFVFGAQSIFAVDNDYKNSLLKIEINEIDSNNYKIGLYTKKVYNEPVKIIKKSDTIYYFLLPETNHSITSTPTSGAIKNILVKTYPYAGQDMNNGYTKVAIITTKPVNLSTSLKILDASISPRLDPVRLAKLDTVFERYSERLAQNNIPTPLAEFRKTAYNNAPAIKSNVSVNTNKEQTKIANANATNSLEEYQNQRNRAQAELNTSTKNQTIQSANQINSSKQAQKSVSATLAKQNTPNKNNSQIKQSATAIKEPVKNPISTKQQTNIKPEIKKQQTTQTEKPKTEKKTLIAQTTKITEEIKEKLKPVESVKTKNESEKISFIPKKETKISETVEKEQNKPTANPKDEPVFVDTKVNLQFESKEPVKEEVQEETKEEMQETESETASASVDNKNQSGILQNINLKRFIPFVFVVLLLFAYLFARASRRKRKQSIVNLAEQIQPVNNKENAKENEPEIINSLLENNQQNKQDEVAEQIQQVHKAQQEREALEVEQLKREFEKQAAEEESINSINELENIENTIEEENVVQEQTFKDEINLLDYEQKNEMVLENSIEDIQDTYSIENNIEMEDNEDISSTLSDIEEISNIKQEQEQEDEVIEQLYTPIETPDYEKEYEPISYNDYQNMETQEEDSDVATIVSSSKLTETRGFYLAKFDGATSLVGYIQDDIYVLYNFGKEEVLDTEIKSTLAQENATDSMYLVKTGGKKLMVKSTPYNMSLEMVM